MKDTKETLIYILKRIGLMLVTFSIIFVLCFILIRLLPLNKATGAGQDESTFYRFQEALGRMERYQYTGDVDKDYRVVPVLKQLGTFLRNLFIPQKTVNGNGEVITLSRWGYAWVMGWAVTPMELMAPKFVPTVLLNVYSMIFSVPLGIGIGVFMALKKNKWQDYTLSTLVMLLISVPSFVTAIFIQQFGVKIGLPLEVANVDEVGSWFAPAMLKSMISPVVAMCLGSIAGYSRYTRAELTEVLTSDFMLLARTKGLSRAQATVRHALRNSMVPIFPMILGEVISVLSGSILIERIFSVNGVGSLFLNSITQKDFDVFQFVSMFYIAIGLVGGLIVDISYGLVDPRIRMGGRK